MKRLSLALFLGLAGSLLAGAASAQDMSDVEIKTIPVVDGIYMLMGSGGNIGVSVGDDGVYIIDDQFAPLTDKIRAAIAAISDKPIRFVINTHWHGDHTGGNENLGTAGSVIVAHDNVRKRMSAGQFMAAFNREVPAAPAAALPVITFNDEVTFHLNGITAKVTHIPHAHTDGDAIIHFAEVNAIHMGDTYFQGRFPFIDTGSGGAIDGVIAGVAYALSIADGETRIIPGHGSLSDAAELTEYGEMLMTVRTRIAAAVAEGTSLEELIESKPLADLAEKYGGGFISADRFTTIVYGDLAAKKK